MKFRIQYTIAFIFVLAGLQSALAQKKDENIGTEVVNVVKPYTPTISDAFKVKETPTLEDEDNTKKEEIKYNIFSFPVASTFTPSKGRAANVDKTPQERIFKNYVTLGIGSYANANAELFVTENVGDNGYVGGMLRHFSSQGGIDDLVLDDKFSNTSLDLAYGNKGRELSWTADLGYQHQVYNWYGIQQDYFGEEATFYDDMDPQHTYHNFYAGAKVDVADSFFKEASVKFNRFWDSYDSAENRFYVKPSFDFDVADTKIKTDLIVDYIGGTFEQDYSGAGEIKYGYTNFGIHPSFVINRNDWTVNLGAAAFYSMDTENSDSKFFIYPQINASLKVVGDLMVFYVGAEGSLEQNSYRDFTNENPFVSPSLFVAPTDRQYDVFAGLKGKLANNVSYNVRGSYTSEKGKALFKNNPFPEALPVDLLDGYRYGNSFGVAYDDVKTVSFFGELKADFSKNVSFGINGTFNSYKSDMEAEAWNLPSVKIGSSLDVNITKKWYAGASVYFVGERKDFLDFPIGVDESRTVTLDSYFDANAHVGYKHNDRLTGFLKFNNIAGGDYERWLNYPVQSFQVMLGASYKFDF